MINLIQDIKAALLYLTCYQFIEDDKNNDKDKRLSLAKEITILHEMGYPDPTQVVYDEDGIPLIKWKSNKFICSDICYDLYESINFNPKYFNQE